MRAPLAVLALLLTLPAFAQERVGDNPDFEQGEGPAIAVRPGEHPKEAERRTFHSGTVRGTTASERAASYARRLAMERDSRYGGVVWRNLGPEIQSGRVVSMASPDREPGTVLVAFATGGLYRTKDDGATWESLWDDMPTPSLGDIAVSPDGRTIWVGTGESNSQRTSYSGTGVYRSTDAGRTWTLMGLPESQHIGKILMDPRDPNTVWVAALGHLYSQNPERGLYKTTDGGKTWTLTLAARGELQETTGAVDFALDPKNPDVITAALWDRERRAWNFREAGRGSGVFRSENGGRTWAPVAGLPVGNDLGRVGLATSKADPKRVYAYVDNQGLSRDWLDEDESAAGGKMTPRRFARLTEATFLDAPKEPLAEFWKEFAPEDAKLDDAIADVQAGKATMADVRARIQKRSSKIFDPGTTLDELYRSDDDGRTFRRQARFGPGGGYYWERAFANPADADDIWVCGVELKRSRDGGRTWRTVGDELHADHHAVLFDASRPGKLWAGTDGGPYVSLNNGETWRILNNLSVGQTTTLALDPRNGDVYTGLQDNGTLKGTRGYVPGRSDINAWARVGGGDGSDVQVEPLGDAPTVYVASQFGAHVGLGADGKRRSAAPRKTKVTDDLRFNWISPLVTSGYTPGLIFVGSQYLHRSFDGGRTWAVISPDLTRNKPNGDVPYSTLKSVSESPLRFGLIYAGADDGRLTMTPDGGYQWLDIPTPAPDKWVARVVASRHTVGTVYAAQSGYREDDMAAYLWKSTDFGKTWTSIVGDLPAETINVVREDSKEPNTLYLGTDLGAFVSRDGGAHWETFGNGLGHLPVHDIAIHERDDQIVLATHARGLFVTPLAPIRALDAATLKTDVKVLPIEDIRVPESRARRPRYAFTDEEPDAPTATIPFFVAKSGPVTITVLDEKEKTLLKSTVEAHRGYNQTDLSLVVRPGKRRPETIPAPQTGAQAANDPLADYRPIYLTTGKYKLTITTADDKSDTRDLVVR